jgi:hypothetical protein
MTFSLIYLACLCVSPLPLGIALRSAIQSRADLAPAAEMLRNLVLGIYSHIILFENMSTCWVCFVKTPVTLSSAFRPRLRQGRKNWCSLAALLQTLEAFAG